MCCINFNSTSYFTRNYVLFSILLLFMKRLKWNSCLILAHNVVTYMTIEAPQNTRPKHIRKRLKQKWDRKYVCFRRCALLLFFRHCSLTWHESTNSWMSETNKKKMKIHLPLYFHYLFRTQLNFRTAGGTKCSIQKKNTKKNLPHCWIHIEILTYDVRRPEPHRFTAYCPKRTFNEFLFRLPFSSLSLSLYLTLAKAKKNAAHIFCMFSVQAHTFPNRP